MKVKLKKCVGGKELRKFCIYISDFCKLKKNTFEVEDQNDDYYRISDNDKNIPRYYIHKRWCTVIKE